LIIGCNGRWSWDLLQFFFLCFENLLKRFSSLC
jgi:hypothetical protein